MKWQSMSTCLDLSWHVGLFASCIADLLSHSTIDYVIEIPKAMSNCFSHSNSEARVASALYSASADDRATLLFFFFYFQVIKEFPKKTQKPVVDLLVTVQLPQSASTYADMRTELELGKRIP